MGDDGGLRSALSVIGRSVDQTLYAGHKRCVVRNHPDIACFLVSVSTHLVAITPLDSETSRHEANGLLGFTS